MYISNLGESAMINHASGGSVWDVMYRLAVAGRFAVLPVGCGRASSMKRWAGGLPDDVPQPVVVVGSGADLRVAVERG